MSVEDIRGGREAIPSSPDQACGGDERIPASISHPFCKEGCGFDGSADGWNPATLPLRGPAA
jgi:hypothetical protein